MATPFQSTLSLFIQAPPGRIYEALTNWNLRSMWRSGIGLVWEGEGKAFLGQRVTFQVKNPIFPYSFSFRITGLEPPRRFYMEYQDKPLRGRAAVEINPSTGSTSSPQARSARSGQAPDGLGSPAGPGPGETGCEVAFHWMKVEPVGWAAKLFFALGLGMRLHRTRTQETLRMLKAYLEKS